MAQDKISKICWNNKGWKFPSGSNGKSKTSKSFEAKFGYGHEEWLFDKSRIVDGWHYGFLQPLNLKSDRHVGKIYNLYLFTVINKIKYSVGLIKNATCIPKDESEHIYGIYKKRSWLKEMREEIERAGGDSKGFHLTAPENFFNVKFKFEDVSINDELCEISDKDNNITVERYKLLPKVRDFKIAVEMSDADDEGKLKNTNLRSRTYKVDTFVDPYHNKMQNSLYKLLRNKFKNEYKKVLIEKNRVDIKAKTYADKWHYFEIKTDSPKMSIRYALGQVMEYSYWPDRENAEKLIIVSDEVPDPETIQYLEHIRNKFQLPVFYRFLDMQKNIISKDF